MNRRSNSDVTRLTAAAVLLAILTGCATPPRPAPPPPKVTVPFPEPAPVVTPPPADKPAGPVLSVGPRPEPREEVPKPAATPPPAPAPPPPTAPPVPPGQRGKFIVLNFDNADVETVIHAASEILGFNYVIGPGVSGKKVTVQTSGRIPQEEVFGVLLAILEVHGVTAVKSGNLYKIVPLEGARERAVPTIVGNTPDPARATDEIITQIVPVRFASVNDLGTLLRPLISTRGTLIANREAGVLIITDSASNIARLLDIIRLVDVEVTQDELQIIPISFADAAELAQILNQLFGSGRIRPPTTGAPTVAPAPAAPGAPVAAPPAVGAGGGADRPPLIIPEKRSNSLIINARKSEMEAIRRIIGQIDVNVSGGKRVFIYFAENAKSKDLTATLNAIYGGRETVPTAAPTPATTPRRAGEPPTPPPPPPTAAPGAPIAGTGAIGIADVALVEGQFRFIADETTNAVIVTTTPRQWLDIEATIKQLDRMPRQVLIEVLIAEVSLTDDTQLGLDWAIRQGRFNVISQGRVTTGGAPQNLVPPNVSLIPSALGVASLANPGLTAFTFAADQFFAILQALAAEDRINVLSNPHIMTSENKKAVINVSASIPIITSQQTGTILTPVTTGGTTTTPSTTGSLNQTVEYKDAGIVLTVTPRIGERGTVALDVKQEVNDIGEQEPPTGSRRINKREAETSVVLVNNQTLVLGGLITDRRAVTERGIPLLSRIPILGFLFGFKEWNIQKRELLILITPRVIGTALDAGRVTDQMRRTTPELDEAIRKSPRPPSEFRQPAPPLAPPAPVPAPVPPATSATPPPAAEPSAPTPAAPAPAAPAPGAPSGVPTIPPAPPAPAVPAPLPPAAIPPPAR